MPLHFFYSLCSLPLCVALHGFISRIIFVRTIHYSDVCWVVGWLVCPLRHAWLCAPCCLVVYLNDCLIYAYCSHMAEAHSLLQWVELTMVIKSGLIFAQVCVFELNSACCADCRVCVCVCVCMCMCMCVCACVCVGLFTHALSAGVL